MDRDKKAAAEAGLLVYHGTPCMRAGHTLRYTHSGICVQCTKNRKAHEAAQNKAPRLSVKKTKPSVDYANLTDAQREAWYAKVSLVCQGKGVPLFKPARRWRDWINEVNSARNAQGHGKVPA